MSFYKYYIITHQTNPPPPIIIQSFAILPKCFQFVGTVKNVKELILILERFKEAVAKFDVLLQKCSLKCKECDFEAKDTNGLVMHMKPKHKNSNKI